MGLAEENAKFFDEMASRYTEKQWQINLSNQITTAFRDNHGWIGADWATDDERASGSRDVRLLDYACGTGLVTRALSPYITSATGIDVSTKMVAEYNAAFAAPAKRDVALTRASAIVGNLLSDPPAAELAGPEYHGFDIAAVGLGFHHFEDAAMAAARLAERLKPGGVLLISDFLHHGDGHPPAAGAAEGHDRAQHGERGLHGHHGHHGHGEQDWQDVPSDVKKAIKVLSFGEENIKQSFEAAGLVDFQVHILPEKALLELGGKHIERTVFLARAMKPKGN